MIIKEFRIIIPMSVDEYQIGQLYTIQKKSRIESTGAGSGVEIIENKPYQNQNENGQYTLKVYHVDERLPASLQTVTKLLFPKSALLFEEESWNSYPYTRTKFKHRLFKSFNIDIESKYLPDYGQSENVFNLKKSELASRIVDYIDIVNDSINSNEYKSEEDPSLFKSVHTNRGPLKSNWIEELKKSASNKQKTYMCAYKLCRIECAFWGCQSRVEKLISESVLRHTILITHRQAWCWQDEYVKLTIDDVRRLEEETQNYLNMKMGNGSNPDSYNSTSTTQKKDKVSRKQSKLYDSTSFKLNQSASNSDSTIDAIANLISNKSEESFNKIDTSNKSKKKVNLKNLKNVGFSSSNEQESIYQSDNEETNSMNKQKITDKSDYYVENDDALSQNSNLDQFYDAISQVSFNLSTNSIESDMNSSVSFSRSSTKSKTSSVFMSFMAQNQSIQENNLKKIHSSNLKSSSASMFENIHESTSSSSLPNSNNIHQHLNMKEIENDPTKIANSSSKSIIDTLVLVVHGGNVTCTDTSKKSDFLNFKSTIESVIKTHYGYLNNHISYRLIKCEPICIESLQKLSSLSPTPNESNMSCGENEESSAAIFSFNENLPFCTIPLLVSANKEQYNEKLNNFIRECNRVYQEFLNSNEGHAFQGQVVIIGDSIGSLLVFDTLCQGNGVTNNFDDISVKAGLSASSSQVNIQATNRQSFKNNNNLSSNAQSPSISPNVPRKENNPLINVNNVNEMDENNQNGTNLTKRSNSSVSSSSGIEFNASPPILATTTVNPLFIPSVSMNIDEPRLEFDVTHFFIFGSPLGLVLAYRKLANKSIEIPCCTQIYNLFHLTDPVATRVEPLLCKQFGMIQPCMVPRYSRFPLGDGSNLSLDHFIVKYGHLFDTNNLVDRNQSKDKNKLGINDFSNSYLTPNFDQLKSLHKIILTKKQWWGNNRIDYVIYAPEKIANLPKKSLPYLFHSCFWESTDVVAFILRMITKSDEYQSDVCETTVMKNPEEPVEKWQKRFNRVKLRNLSSNHRANDIILLEDKEQVLTAKFSYGPLDFVLSGEKVEIYIMENSVKNEWQFYATEITDSHGKIKYKIPSDKRLPLGMYQIKMIVKCDHSFVDFHMAILPANTEAAVFSIDGSFAANLSLSGTDPKVRAGSVDIVRHWQELGYLIIYVTARPDIQHYKVTNWFSQHNFPLGMVYFSDGLRRDPIKQKTETLKNLVFNNNIKIEAAYGSSKDIAMYANLGVKSDRIFIIGKPKTKYQSQAVFLKEGYASHLSNLQNPNTGSRQAAGNARLIIKKNTFNTRANNILNNQNSQSQINLKNQCSLNENDLMNNHSTHQSTFCLKKNETISLFNNLSNSFNIINHNNSESQNKKTHKK